jgi:hypothetical protein
VSVPFSPHPNGSFVLPVGLSLREMAAFDPTRQYTSKQISALAASWCWLPKNKKNVS